MRKKDVDNIVTFDLIGLLPTNHCLSLYYNGTTELYDEMFDALLTVKELKQCKSRVYRKWQTLAIIPEISYSNLETGRYGPKSGVSRIIRES